MEMIINNWGDGYENSGHRTTLKTSDGKELSVEFRDGEPEDMVIGRDLNDALSIPSLIKAAYNAGKNGEELIIIELDNDENED